MKGRDESVVNSNREGVKNENRDEMKDKITCR